MKRIEKGFTLIELIMMIVILGILAAVAIPKFMDLSGEAEESVCRSNKGAIESACAIYYASMAVTGQTPTFPVTYKDGSLYASGEWPSCPSGGGDYLYQQTNGTCICLHPSHN